MSQVEHHTLIRPRIAGGGTELLRMGDRVPFRVGGYHRISLHGLRGDTVDVIQEAAMASRTTRHGHVHPAHLMVALGSRVGFVWDGMARAMLDILDEEETHDDLPGILEEMRVATRNERRPSSPESIPDDLMAGILGSDNACSRLLTGIAWPGIDPRLSRSGRAPWIALFARYSDHLPALRREMDERRVPCLLPEQGGEPQPLLSRDFYVPSGTGTGVPASPAVPEVASPSSGRPASPVIPPTRPRITEEDVLRGLPAKAAWDPDRLWERLSREFPWMEQANLLVCQGAAAIAAGKARRIKPLLLVGQPGVGKSRWVRTLAGECGAKTTSLTVGGAVSGAAVSGFERTWNRSETSLPVKAMLSAGASDPLVFLDEIDKAAAGGTGGSVHEALLSLLDRDSCSTYHDVHHGRSVDAGRITWMLAANGLSSLPPPLLNRVEVVQVRKATEDEAWSVMTAARRAAGKDDADSIVRSDLDAMMRCFREGGFRPAFDRMERLMQGRLWSPPERVVPFARPEICLSSGSRPALSLVAARD